MEKSEFLKARVSSELNSNFSEICSSIGKTTSHVLRELITSFVEENISKLSDPVSITIYRPDNYETGAWRIKMKLKDSKSAQIGDLPIAFSIPKLERRMFISDKPHQAVTFDRDTDQYVMGAIFINGEWNGDVYSNGVSEKSNPTPIGEVEDALRDAVHQILYRTPA